MCVCQLWQHSKYDRMHWHFLLEFRSGADEISTRIKKEKGACETLPNLTKYCPNLEMLLNVRFTLIRLFQKLMHLDPVRSICKSIYFFTKHHILCFKTQGFQGWKWNMQQPPKHYSQMAKVAEWTEFRVACNWNILEKNLSRSRQKVLCMVRQLTRSSVAQA